MKPGHSFGDLHFKIAQRHDSNHPFQPCHRGGGKMPRDVHDVVIGVERRVEHSLDLDERLDHPAVVVAHGLEELAAPHVLQHPTVLGDGEPQELKSGGKVKQFHLVRLRYEFDDVATIKQDERPFDGVVLDEAGPAVHVQGQVDQQFGGRAIDMEDDVLPIWLSQNHVVDVEAAQLTECVSRQLSDSFD